MQAVVITISIDPAKAELATGLLHEQVVPNAKASPGFVSGVWARSRDGRNGHSVVLYENEESARAVLAQATQGPFPGAPVTVLSAEVYEVLAQA